MYGLYNNSQELQKAIENIADIYLEEESLTFDMLDEEKQKTLTAAYMRDMKDFSYETIVESSAIDEITGYIIRSLEDDKDSSEFLVKKIQDSVIEYCKEPINECLEIGFNFYKQQLLEQQENF